jgi:hypothetical protein
MATAMALAARWAVERPVAAAIRASILIGLALAEPGILSGMPMSDGIREVPSLVDAASLLRDGVADPSPRKAA